MTSQTGRQDERGQPKQDGQVPRWTFRFLSVGGAMVLLLLLVVALLWPGGKILAFKDRTAVALPAAALHPVSLAWDNVQVVTSTVPVTVTGVVTEAAVEVAPELAAQCYGCIEGWIIDRYHRTQYFTGWTVKATSQGGATPITVAADGVGYFRIPAGKIPPGLCAGTYQVELQVPQGWEAITPASFPVTLAGDEAKTKQGCAKVRYKVGILPILEVLKLDQYARPGTAAGLPDWEFTASNGATQLAAITNGTGRASFGAVPLGTWKVTEQVKTGWVPVNPASGSQTITIAPPTKPVPVPWVITLKFVNKQIRTGCIQVCKSDVTGSPLCGWTMTVYRDDGTQAPRPGVTRATSRKECCALFCDLPMGDYSVVETVKPHYVPDPEIGDWQKVKLTMPAVTERVDFVNEALGCLDGYKMDYLDLRPLQGWQVTAINDFTGDTFVATTDAKGYFRFDDIPLGPYTIEETVKAGWQPVTSAKQQADVTRVWPDCTHVRFKNIRDSACLCVYKRDYADPKHLGIAGWPITLKPSYGGTAITLETDGTGKVCFDGLEAGFYDLSETVLPGWVAVGKTVFQKLELVRAEPCLPRSWAYDPKKSLELQYPTFWNRQKTDTPPRPVDPPAPSKSGCCRTWHTVRQGNTLYSIARYYGTTVNSLMRVNHIANANVIYVGQRLCIP